MDTWKLDNRRVKFEATKTDQYEWFWPKVASGEWEPETFLVLEQNLHPDLLYIDIGAWIGPTVLYAAGLAGRVVAVEPDAVAMAELTKNLALNPYAEAKVELCNFAVAAKNTSIDLYAHKFGDSMTSLLPSRGARKITFLAKGIGEFLDSVINDEKECFIKMDIEGSEYQTFPVLCQELTARGIKADIFLSLHAVFNVSENFTFADWAKNLELNATVLNAAATYGEVHCWDKTSWRPLQPTDHPHLIEILLRGGLTTTLLVKGRDRATPES